MISREIFSWFDSSAVKKLKLINSMGEFSIMADLTDKYHTE